MTDLSVSTNLTIYKPKHKVRFVTAASLFDGHDASINIMRRILQAPGAEVIHLGHNRSVEEIVTAALQEDVQGIAVSSYQGGHVEYFKYMVDLLRERGGEQHQGVRRRRRRDRAGGDRASCRPTASARIYSPEDGQRMGLQGMINEHGRCAATSTCRAAGAARRSTALHGRRPARAGARDHRARERRARRRRCARRCCEAAAATATCRCSASPAPAASGKSSLTDELIRRFRLDQDDRLRHRRHRRRPVAAQARRRAARRPHPHERDRRAASIFMRSLATRDAGSEIADGAARRRSPRARSPGFDLVDRRDLRASARATRRSCRSSTCRST